MLSMISIIYWGRSISIDVLVKDGDTINIEVQRDTKGAHPKRARFHGSLIDANTSFPNEQWIKAA